MDLNEPAMEAARVRMVGRFGEGVAAWWSGLPALVERLAQRWSLQVGEVVGRGGSSVVVRCARPGDGRGFLKLTPGDFTAAEAAALDHWAPTGRVPLVWERDLARGALLLEGLPSDEPLAARPRDVTTAEVADLVRALHGAGDTGTAAAARGAGDFPPLRERLEFIYRHFEQRYLGDDAAREAVPVASLHRARDLALELDATWPAPSLVHGDLHPGNVIDGGPVRGLLAFDPRPCLGDPHFDLVDWITWRSDDQARWRARSGELATALGYDLERTWAWVQAFAAPIAAMELGRSPGCAARAAALMGIAP